MSRPRLLCVHQGFELYGSDRTFLQSLSALRRRFPDGRITAILPGQGPLVGEVRPLVDRLEILDLMVLRRKHLRRIRPASLGRARRRIRRASEWIEGHDLTYVNTVVLLDFLLASRHASKPTLLHVHEIPVGAEQLLFSSLVRYSGSPVVFNSNATRRSFQLPPDRQTSVVWNGTAGPSSIPGPPAEDPAKPMRVLMLGRFHSWKGQELLMQALGRMSPAERGKLSVRMAGSGFEQPDRRNEFGDRIRKHGIESEIRVEPFVADPAPLYRWADVVVMPSMRPEPFGLVAIESMAHGRPVIAAGHGGLTEIVEDRRTGLLHTPRSAISLARALGVYLRERPLLGVHGAAGRQRFEACFRESRYLDAIGEVAATVLKSGEAAV